MTLTRRDRAAMVLALEWARSPVPPHFAVAIACDALELGGHYAQRMGRSIDRSGFADRDRLPRARLALALRAMLRADAGDCGPADIVGDKSLPPMCTTCWDDVPPVDADDDDEDGRPCTQPGCDGHAETRSHPARYQRIRYAPLWQQAPRTGEGRRTAGLRRRGV